VGISRDRRHRPRHRHYYVILLSLSDDVEVLGAFAAVGVRPSATGRPSGGVAERVAGDDRVESSARRAVDVRQVYVLDGRLDGGRAGPGERAAAEQVPVEVFAEHAADEV